MVAKHSNVALIALLFAAGCGGSDDTAVSANPPAPPPAAATPAPIATPAPGIAPVPAKVPVPSPVTTVPPTPEPPPPSAPDVPPPPPPLSGPSISGSTLIASLSTTYYQANGGLPITGTLEGDQTNVVNIYQRVQCDAVIPQCYHSTGSSNYTASPIPSISLYNTIGTSSEGATLGELISTEQVQLFKVGGFTIEAAKSYALDQTIAQWDAAPWFVQLQLQSDARSNTVFRMCWHYRLPTASRLACSKNDTIMGDIRGIYVVDDSFDTGAKTWETR